MTQRESVELGAFLLLIVLPGLGFVSFVLYSYLHRNNKAKILRRLLLGIGVIILAGFVLIGVNALLAV